MRDVQCRVLGEVSDCGAAVYPLRNALSALSLLAIFDPDRKLHYRQYRDRSIPVRRLKVVDWIMVGLLRTYPLVSIAVCGISGRAGSGLANAFGPSFGSF